MKKIADDILYGVCCSVFALGGIYTLCRIWFGTWSEWENTIFYSWYQRWGEQLSSQWVLFSTIGFGLITAIGFFGLAVMSWYWLEERKRNLRRKK